MDIPLMIWFQLSKKILRHTKKTVYNIIQESLTKVNFDISIPFQK